MGAQQIGLPQQCQHSKKGLGRAHLLSKKFKGMRERMTDWPAQFSQTESVEKGFHLVANTLSTVLEILVVKSQAWIDAYLLNAHGSCLLDSLLKPRQHDLDGILVKTQILD